MKKVVFYKVIKTPHDTLASNLLNVLTLFS